MEVNIPYMDQNHLGGKRAIPKKDPPEMIKQTLGITVKAWKASLLCDHTHF